MQRFCDADARLMQPGPGGKLLRSWGRVTERNGIHYQPWEIDGEKHYTCPLAKVPSWWPRVWDLHCAAEKGLLPDPGGLRDQPAWYSRVMPHVAGCIAKYRDQRMKREAASRGHR
jgi:hypothetical protein